VTFTNGPFGRPPPGRSQGKEVSADLSACADWCRLGAELGSTAAQNEWGVCLLHGRGVTPNAAQAGQWFERAAQAGDPSAAFNLAALLEEGAEGLPPDPIAALAWYQTSAGAGFAPAMNNLALLIERGELVEQDAVAAFVLYRHAAESGYRTAMLNLARCYKNGIGVEPNSELASTWMLRLEEQSHIEQSSIENRESNTHPQAERGAGAGGYVPKRGSANYNQAPIKSQVESAPGWAEFDEKYGPKALGEES
jgi:TPR repeat protein